VALLQRGGSGAGAGGGAQTPTLERSAVLTGTVQKTSQGMPSLGYVEAMYTYGAPATAKPALTNLMSEDGCFKGLRSYNEDVISGGVTKEVDAGAISNFYPHSKIATAVLHQDGESIYVPCKAGDDPATLWPNDNDGGVFADWTLHWEDDYTPRLLNVQVEQHNVSALEPFHQAYLFVLLAYKTYDSTAHALPAIHARLPGWKLVATETRIQGSGGLYDEDPVLLVQDSKSLDCALVFTGTNNIDNELGTSMTTYGAGYCGFAQVHDGYKNELWDITHDLWPGLRPKLSKCNKVYCVGHSLGGSLCEIFTACANSQRFTDPDYQNQMWSKGTPEAMPEIETGGTVYVDGAEHRCEEPPCPKNR